MPHSCLYSYWALYACWQACHSWQNLSSSTTPFTICVNILCVVCVMSGLVTCVNVSMSGRLAHAAIMFFPCVTDDVHNCTSLIFNIHLELVAAYKVNTNTVRYMLHLSQLFHSFFLYCPVFKDLQLLKCVVWRSLLCIVSMLYIPTGSMRSSFPGICCIHCTV